MLGVGGNLVALVDFVPLRGRHLVLIAAVVEVGDLGIVRPGIDFTRCGPKLLRNSPLQAFLLGHEFGIAAQQNVGAAAGHVGGDGDRALASGLGHDLGFLLVVLGIQHDVLHALFLQQV